ncbi:unnamed protein product [Caenorhabditis angaria]|uniref:Innexin n=1 Tax=Caenorhabditis angaria TaxID=860376 RepID=A0A9P1NBQ6_9PELO|nr:unnamed protein product [Caenorhabditis angaria]
MIGFFNPLYDHICRIINRQFNQLAYDRIDQLNSWFTPMVIGALTLAISCKQYFGQPLKCWTPREFSGSWDGYVHDYCFIEDTYFVPNGTEITDVARGDRQINYYRWVPLVLMLQALLFVIPYMIWNVMHKRTSINLKGSLRMYQKQLKTSGSAKANESFAIELTEKLEKINEENRTLAACQTTIHYFLLKILYIFNCVLQMFIIKRFLNLDDYLWGFEHLWNVEFNGTAEHENSIFPRVVLCDFVIRMLGQKHRHTVSCIMMLNMIIEKVYIGLYFWIVFVFIATTTALFTFAIQMLFRKHSLIPTNLKRHDLMNPERTRQFINNYLNMDGVLLITFLDAQFGAYRTSQVVDELVKIFVKNKSSANSLSSLFENKLETYAKVPFVDSNIHISGLKTMNQLPNGGSLGDLKEGIQKIMKIDEVNATVPEEEKKTA